MPKIIRIIAAVILFFHGLIHLMGTTVYMKFGSPNCITENVTMGSMVASGKMLLSDRHKSLSEERHDEPEQQARVTRSSTTTVPQSQ